MTNPAVRLSRAAEDDVRAAVEHYLEEGGIATAQAFREALEKAFWVLARFPSAGSL